jgi:hypothetical protein
MSTPASTSFAAEAPASDQLLQNLRVIVQRNARRWRLLILAELCAVLVAVPLGYLWAVFSLDILLHLPPWGRAATSVAFAAVLLWLARWLLRRLKSVRLTEDQVALAIERQSPGSHNRLINSLQISRERGASPGHEAALLRENHASLQHFPLRQAVASGPALALLACAAMTVGIGVCFYLLKREHFTNAAARIFQPFAPIAPLYRTTLEVDPGDIEVSQGENVSIRIRVTGERPATIVVRQTLGDIRSSEQLSLPGDADTVEYTFRNLQRSLSYSVAAGDYVSPVYHIQVPVPPQVTLVSAAINFPEYTGMTPRKIESRGGDLEALVGSRAEVTFTLDQPADTAALLPDRASTTSEDPNGAMPNPQPLTKVGATQFRGEIRFDGTPGYRLSVQRGTKAATLGIRYALRALPDQPPLVTLSGLDRQTELLPGNELPLKLSASDDYGIAEAALFARRLIPGSRQPVENEGWQALERWPQTKPPTEWKREHALAFHALGAVEGDKVEVVLRARDADPAKKEVWATSDVFTLLLGGDGAQFQLLYEQILQSEAEIRRLVAASQQVVSRLAEWIQKLDPSSGMRWDDKANLDALAGALRAQAAEQESLRQGTGEAARALVTAAGNLRFSLGMLADTEMVRALRATESAPVREDPLAKRAALSDARNTQERTVRSLGEILEQYVVFRQNWELANMVPMVKMLGDREASLQTESAARIGATPPPAVAQVAAQRQTKLHALSELVQTALTGIGARTAPVDEPLGQAFADAAAAFDSGGVKAAMLQAVESIRTNDWSRTAGEQSRAAGALLEIHAALKKAAADAIARAARDAGRTPSNLAAQKELGKMMAGSGIETETFRQDLSSISQVVEMREAEAVKNKGALGEAGGNPLPAISEELAASMKTVESNLRPDLSTLKLGNRIEATGRFDQNDALRPNEMVAPLVPDNIEDLVGKLLEEADEMEERFDNITANSGLTSADPGEVGKLGGRMNSSGATSTTGNKKPPTTNVGGMSATGRQGARSYGKVAGSESPNMRGRDKAQEGQFEVPDQAGVLKEKKTDDMQADTSTGIGGKRVDAEKTKFSTSDKGEWNDKFAERMQKPQEVNTIVERQGKPLDPKVAAMLRDMEGEQKQLIERANALRKELKNLYLPTDHLDEITAQMAQNADRLRENPTAENFRTQRELLDRLRNEARVFNRAQTGFVPSLPREQRVRGRILDEPAAPPLPGYENAVKEYYIKLARP